MSRITSPITYGYADFDYIINGYVVRLLGVSIVLTHSEAGSIQFAKGFKYPAWSFDILQPSISSALGYPTYSTPVFSQMSFETTWPWVTDEELSNLRNWMFTSIPLFDTLSMECVGRDHTINVRFANRNLKVKQLRKGYNEVAFSLVRV